ncbi:MAG: hypothetical protein IKU25_02995, partial [Clostridia bacterium]|nr:hypothetical protein [Clostridia bacterium]
MGLEPERAESAKKNSSGNCFSANRCEAGTVREAYGRRAVQIAKRFASSPISARFDETLIEVFEPERAESAKKNSSGNCFSANRCEAGTVRGAYGRRAVQIAKRFASSPISARFDEILIEVFEPERAESAKKNSSLNCFITKFALRASEISSL